MATKTNKASATTAEAGADARYEVSLNARFLYMDFHYMPGHPHDVDAIVKKAMEDAGVIADVKQLS